MGKRADKKRYQRRHPQPGPEVWQRPANFPPLRDWGQVQQAHDALLPLVTGEVKVDMSARQELIMRASVDVLCWVLQHDHNQAFGDNLAELRQQLAEAGYLLKGPHASSEEKETQ